MKKGLLVLISIVLICSFLVGCSLSNKKLVCSSDQNGSKFKITLDFVSNKIRTMKLDWDIDLSSYSDELVDMYDKRNLCSSVKSYMSEFGDAFNSCNQKIVNKHIKIHSNVNIKKIDKATYKNIQSPAKAKKEIEKQNFKCSYK